MEPFEDAEAWEEHSADEREGNSGDNLVDPEIEKEHSDLEPCEDHEAEGEERGTPRRCRSPRRSLRRGRARRLGLARYLLWARRGAFPEVNPHRSNENDPNSTPADHKTTQHE